MFGGAISARLLRRPSRTQTKRETAINQRPIRVSVVPCGRIQSITILSDPQQRSRGVWEPVKAEVLPEPAWISAGSVRFGSVGSDAGELSTMIIYWPKEHQKHTKRSSSPAHKQRFRTDPVRLEGGISFSFSMTAEMRWFRSISSSFHR